MMVIFCSEARVENHFRSFSTKEVMSVTSSAPIVRSRIVAVLYDIGVKSAR